MVFSETLCPLALTHALTRAPSLARPHSRALTHAPSHAPSLTRPHSKRDDGGGRRPRRGAARGGPAQAPRRQLRGRRQGLQRRPHRHVRATPRPRALLEPRTLTVHSPPHRPARLPLCHPPLASGSSATGSWPQSAPICTTTTAALSPCTSPTRHSSLMPRPRPTARAGRQTKPTTTTTRATRVTTQATTHPRRRRRRRRRR